MTIGSKRGILPRTMTTSMAASIMALMVAGIILTGLCASASGVNPGLMLAAGRELGAVPHAFYITGNVVVGSPAAPRVMDASRRILNGCNAIVSEVSYVESNGMACVAVSLTIQPNARHALEAVRLIRSALGRKASVALCLTGYTSESSGQTASRLDAYSGITIAVSPTGDIYLGMPYIPIPY